MKQRVLIISYYWPPAGGPGVQRWLKFVKYLPKFDIQPVVYVPLNPTYPLQDSNLLEQMDPGVTILKNKISEPYKFAKLFWPAKSNNLSAGMIPAKRKQTKVDKLLLWTRGNLFIPDARVGWVNSSVNYLSNYLAQNKDIKTIITTGPPHSMHLIGLGLKQCFDVNWIADFRDPWTTIGYHKDLKLLGFAAKKHIDLEKKVLQKADHIIVTSKSTQHEFSQKTSKPISVITNGYDTMDVGKVELDQKFTLAHIGSFLSDRNPRVLWKAICELRKENPSFKQAFELKLVGKVSQEILDTIAEFKLDQVCINMGYLSHTKAYMQMKASWVLLLIEIDSDQSKCIIPGKLFEYMASERPILAIGPEQADFFEIIQATNTGKSALYTQKEQIKEIILDYFKAYQQGKLSVHGIGLQHYSRYRLTQNLANIIKDMDKM
ncbi:glycosyltransferase family protein [Myroides sp. LJL119]